MQSLIDDNVALRVEHTDGAKEVVDMLLGETNVDGRRTPSSASEEPAVGVRSVHRC